jgi:4-hydroxybenzoate polyprenyltransferase
VIAEAARIYQWSKNLLVFVPLALSHQIFRQGKLQAAAVAFLALSAAASMVYIANDLLDIDADRKHPRKHGRPFAAGRLKIGTGVMLAAVFLAVASILTLFLLPEARFFVAGYIVACMLYSAFFKQILFLDITVLAGLFTLRILYGGAATGTVISPWTLAFSIFLFTSLAVCKRLTELRHFGGGDRVPGRAYSQRDAPALLSLGAGSAFAAIVVLALYLNSPDVLLLYRHPRVLWTLCPLFSWWAGRILILANRGEMHDDPIVFALRDRASLGAALLSALAIAGAL